MQLDTCCPALDAIQVYQGISTILSLSTDPELFQIHHSSFALPSISFARPPKKPLWREIAAIHCHKVCGASHVQLDLYNSRYFEYVMPGTQK